MTRRLAACSIVFALVVSACTPAGDSTGDAGITPDQVSSTTDESGSGNTSGTPQDTDVPPTPVLSVSSPTVYAGDAITVTANARRSGVVTMGFGEDIIASGAMTEGVATITVPGTAIPGTYLLEMTDDSVGSAFGVIRVADGPSLWLSAPTWIDSGEPTRVTVTTFGIPAGMTVALELTADGQTAERLVPHPIAGLAPVPFGGDPGEGIPRGQTTLVLPDGFTGSVRAVADQAAALTRLADTEEGLAIVSSATRIRRCDEPTGVTGNLGSPGIVRVVRVEGDVGASSAMVEDGSFTVLSRPGTVMLTAYRGLDATAASPQLLQLKCGDILDVGSVDEAVDTGPSPGTYLGGKTIDDMFSYAATATGDIQFSHDSVVECSATGSEIELSFSTPGGSPYLYYITIPDFSGTGRYDAEFRILNVFEDGESSGQVSMEIEQGRIDDFDALGGVFSATYGGDLGSGTVEGTFECIFVSTLQTSTPTIRGAALSGSLLAAPVIAARGAGGSGGDEKCRTAIVVPTGDYEVIQSITNYYTATTFEKRIRRVSAINAFEIGGFFKLLAGQQLLDTDEEDRANFDALAEAIAADYMVTFKVTKFGESWILSANAFDLHASKVFFRRDYTASTEGALLDQPVAPDMAAAFREVAICGEVDETAIKVKAGEEKEITYTLTDLAGEVGEGTIDAVSSSCGTFDPESGKAESGKFKTTFTGGTGGCTDQVIFVARTDTQVGEVTTEQDADTSTSQIAIPTFSYRYTIDFASTSAYEDSDGISYSSGSASFHAESEGEFFIESDLQAVIGAGNGRIQGGDPAAPCVVITESGSTLTPQKWTVEGAYSVMVSGNLASGAPADGGTLRLLPDGYRLNVVGSWSDPECFPPGSQNNEIWSYVTSSIFVMSPALLVGAFPDGFEISFTADGQRTTKSWPITIGGGTGNITIEVWQQDEGG